MGTRIAVVFPLFIASKETVAVVERALDSVHSRHHELTILPVYNYVCPELEGYRAGPRSGVAFCHIQGRQPQSVAKAWNDGLRLAAQRQCRYVLFANQDAVLKSTAIDRLVAFAEDAADPTIVLWSMVAHGDLDTLEQAEEAEDRAEYPNFAAFMVRADFAVRHGYFDENFVPAYFEDNDMHARIVLSGAKAVACAAARFYHYRSQILHSVPAIQATHDARFEVNRTYFVCKWGHLPVNEPAEMRASYWKHPFNEAGQPLHFWPAVSSGVEPANGPTGSSERGAGGGGAQRPAASSRDDEAGLVWAATFYDPSGYADEARNFVLALDRLGVSVQAKQLPASVRTPLPGLTVERLRQLEQASIPDRYAYVMHCLGRYFQRDRRAALSIGRTMFETDRLPPYWVAKCNDMDQVWVPSEFNVETFARAGVARSKLRCVPEALDTELYDPNLPVQPLIERQGFVFLSVFGWSLRKGWDVLVRAYVEEFHHDDDVILLLKVISPAGIAEVRAEVEKFVRRDLRRDPLAIPRIRLLGHDLGVEGLPRLYRSADAYVMPSRGEGWGRPYMEAMAMGLPTIGTRFSGNTQFMSDDNAYLIDYKLVAVPFEGWQGTPYYRGHRWAEPSVDHLRQLMRRVFAKRQEARAKGAVARKEIVRRYNREQVARDVLAELGRAGFSAPSLCAQKASSFTVTWEGSQFTHHSMALANREFCRELLASNRVALRLLTDVDYDPRGWPEPEHAELAARIGVVHDRPADVHVRHEWPPKFMPPSQGHWVMIQPWEYGSLPKAWIEPMNRLVDEVWVPSTWVRECYVGSGVAPSQVAVVPNGVDTRRFNPAARPLDLPTRKRFKFLFVGGTIPRKGIELMVQTYLEVFHRQDDVCLVVKDFGSRSFYRGQNLGEQIRQFAADPRNAEILYLGGDDLPDASMPGLYTACQCYVHPYRAEGFGLPIAEAMACGLPVIVPQYGGCLDYCDPTVCYFVPAWVVREKHARVGSLETVDRPWWVQVNPEALARAMVQVVEHPNQAREVGRRASLKIHSQFTWGHAAGRILDRLEYLTTRPIRRLAGTGKPVVNSETRRTLSVCVIAKDEEHRLGRCLDCARGLADEVIVVDTGSADRTAELARELGAKVHHFVWNDDWAAARNESLRHATKDWILVLDADQTIDLKSHGDIRRLIQTDECVGYLLRQLNYRDDGASSITEHLTLRLFPNHPEIRYAGRIHEQVVCRRADLNFRAVPCDVVIHHDGYRPSFHDPRKKAVRDLPILEQLIVEAPDDPFNFYNLGNTCLVLDRILDAERHLRRAVALCAGGMASGSYPPYLPHAYVMLATALIHNGQCADAVACCQNALRLSPDYSDAHCTLGTAQARLGHFPAAVRAYTRALACQPEPALAPTDKSTAGWKALLGLAEVHIAEGRRAEALARLSQAEALRPGDEAMHRLRVAALQAGPA